MRMEAITVSEASGALVVSDTHTHTHAHVLHWCWEWDNRIDAYKHGGNNSLCGFRCVLPLSECLCLRHTHTHTHTHVLYWC